MFLSILSTDARRFNLVQLTGASAKEGRIPEDIPRLLSPPEKADPARRTAALLDLPLLERMHYSPTRT
jgi:hypothetical protein